MKKTIEELKQKLKGYFADVGALRIEVSYLLQEESYVYRVQQKCLVEGEESSIITVTDWKTVYTSRVLEEAMSFIETKKHLKLKKECEDVKTYMYF